MTHTTTTIGKMQAAYEVGAEVRDFAGTHGLTIDMDLVEARIAELAGAAHEGTFLWQCAKVANRWTTKRFALDATLTAETTAAPATHRAPEAAPVVEEVVEKRVRIEEVVVELPVFEPEHGRCQDCRQVVDVLAYGAAAYHTAGRRKRVCQGWNKPALAVA
jgi:hypothetical protein